MDENNNELQALAKDIYPEKTFSYPQNKTIFEALAETTIISNAGGDLLGGDFSPISFMTSAQSLASGSLLAMKYIEWGMPEVGALAVAAVFISENGCDCGGHDIGEYNMFMAPFGGGTGSVTNGQSSTVFAKHRASWDNERIPGFGEGIGSWTYSSMKKMVLGTIGMNQWCPFYNFTLEEQIEMAWNMLNKYQTAAKRYLMDPGIRPDQAVEAVLLGIENGGGATLATREAMDKYTWAAKHSKNNSGFEGLMNLHLGSYQTLQAHWLKCKVTHKNPSDGAKLSARETGYTHCGKEIETKLPGFNNYRTV